MNSGLKIVLHYNPHLNHQKDHAKWFTDGFKKHGISLISTTSRTEPGDIHIVSGPYYCKEVWLNHPNVLLIDRCYYKGDPDHVSLGWMDSDGDRTFIEGAGRLPPTITESSGDKSIYLADYNGILEKADIVRMHPENFNHSTTLEEDLKQCNRASGYRTTALVTAALMGLETVSKHPKHILNYPNWLQLLPYIDWNYREIANGEAWAHLHWSLDQRKIR